MDNPYSDTEILGFYLPLFLNQSAMTLTAPFLNFGVSRALDPESALAAFGAAFSLTIIINSIVFTSLKVFNSHLRDKESFRIILGFYLWFGLLGSLGFAAAGLTPAGDRVFTGLMNLGPETAVHAKEWMAWNIPVPVLIAVRCGLQGLTTVYRKTGNTAAGTVQRLGIAIAAVLVLIRLFPDRPGMAAGAAFSLAILAEVVYLIFRTRQMRAFSTPTSVKAYSTPLTFSYLFRFSLPLWMSSAAWTGSFPLINYFIGQTVNSEAGVAGFSILRALNVTLTSPLFPLVTVFLILGNKATIRRLTLLGASLAAVLTLACVWLAFTPAKTLLLTRVFNLSGQALVWSEQALVFFLATPLLLLVRCVFEGILMRTKQPAAIGITGGIRLMVLCIAGWTLLDLFPAMEGVRLGMALVTIAALSDALVLILTFAVKARAAKP